MMATVLPAFNPVAGVAEAISPVAMLIAQRRQQQQLFQRQQQQQQTQQGALQQLGGQFGLSLPPGLDPQTAAILIGNAQQAALQPQAGQQGFTLSPGQQRFGPGGQPLASIPDTSQAGFTLSPGQQRFGAAGQAVAQVAPLPEPSPPRAGALQVSKADDPSGLPIGTVFQADPQGNVKILSEPGGEGLSGKDKVNLAVTQSKEFLADKRVADFQEVERGARGIFSAFDRSIKSGKKGPSDQALGVLFQKMLDPGSVVRQSEFARTAEGQGVLDKLIGGLQKTVTGGIGLTQEERKELVQVAKLLLNESKVTFNQTFEEFQTRADEIGLNKKIVFGGAKPFDIAGQVTDNKFDLTGALRQGANQFGIPGLSQNQQQFRSPQQESRMQELLRKAGQ